jgi:RecA-family ATPase
MNMPTLKESALHYAEQGFAVFPLIPREKKPATTNGFKDATTDPKQISFWWDMDPNYNIGIATGKPSGGLVVIDIDNGHGGNGSDSLRDWERNNHNLPDTCTALTGSGGVHLYYRDTEEYRNKAGILDSVDVRGDGGYIVAPPSVHPNGGSYEWEVDHSPDDMKVTQADETVRKFLNPKKKEPKQEAKPVDDIFPKGKRVDSLVRMIGAMKNWGISDSAIKMAVQVENMRRCDPPLEIEELNREVFPAIDRDWVATQPYTETESVSSLPEPENLAEIWDNRPPLSPELIKGVLRRGHKMLISASSKAGKSYMLVNLIVCAVEGQKWLGLDIEKGGRWLYVNMEIDRASIYDRFAKVYEARGLTPHLENIDVWNLRGHITRLDELTDIMIRKFEERRYDAIVLDPIYKLMMGDENSNSDMAKLVNQLDRIAEHLNCAVIYAHHFSKGFQGQRKSIDRGSGAGVFGRDPDAIISVTRLDYDCEDRETEGTGAFRVEFNLREFDEHPPVDVFWKHPVHLVDTAGKLKTYQIETEDFERRKAMAKQNDKRKEEEARKKKLQVIRAAETAEKEKDGTFKTKSFINAYALIEGKAPDRKTAEKLLEGNGFVKISQGDGKANLWIYENDED